MLGFIIAILNVFSSIFIGIYLVIGTFFGYRIISMEMKCYKDMCTMVAKIRNTEPADVICKESIFFYIRDLFKHIFLWPFILYRIDHPKNTNDLDDEDDDDVWYAPSGKYDPDLHCYNNFDVFDSIFEDPKFKN